MSTRRPLVPLALILTLLGLAAAPARAMGPFEFLLERLSAIWAETGCTFDPNGGCSDRSAPTGCTVDPDGGCSDRSAPTGCTGDPNGVCRDQGAARQITENTGCTFDPDGRCRETLQAPSAHRDAERRHE